MFGQIKDGRRCDRFMRRGITACDSEWKLLCATHNLLKLWHSLKAKVKSRLAMRGRMARQVCPA